MSTKTFSVLRDRMRGDQAQRARVAALKAAAAAATAEREAMKLATVTPTRPDGDIVAVLGWVRSAHTYLAVALWGPAWPVIAQRESQDIEETLRVLSTDLPPLLDELERRRAQERAAPPPAVAPPPPPQPVQPEWRALKRRVADAIGERTIHDENGERTAETEVVVDWEALRDGILDLLCWAEAHP